MGEQRPEAKAMQPTIAVSADPPPVSSPPQKPRVEKVGLRHELSNEVAGGVGHCPRIIRVL